MGPTGHQAPELLTETLQETSKPLRARGGEVMFGKKKEGRHGEGGTQFPCVTETLWIRYMDTKSSAFTKSSATDVGSKLMEPPATQKTRLLQRLEKLGFV